jgi:hypothetical protein
MCRVLFAVAVLVSPHAARADDAADAKSIVERAIKARGDKPGDKPGARRKTSFSTRHGRSPRRTSCALT